MASRRGWAGTARSWWAGATTAAGGCSRAPGALRWRTRASSRWAWVWGTAGSGRSCHRVGLMAGGAAAGVAWLLAGGGCRGVRRFAARSALQCVHQTCINPYFVCLVAHMAWPAHVSEDSQPRPRVALRRWRTARLRCWHGASTASSGGRERRDPGAKCRVVNSYSCSSPSLQAGYFTPWTPPADQWEHCRANVLAQLLRTTCMLRVRWHIAAMCMIMTLSAYAVKGRTTNAIPFRTAVLSHVFIDLEGHRITGTMSGGSGKQALRLHGPCEGQESPYKISSR